MQTGIRRFKGMFLPVVLLGCWVVIFCGGVPTVGQTISSVAAAQNTDAGRTLDPEQRALAGLPPYRPQEVVSGTIRLWGHGAPILDFMGMLVKSWEEGFQKFQPGVRFEYDMYGTASAMGALYAGKGDIAILGQEIYPFETAAFERVKHYAPTEIEIATGSVDVRNFDFAIGVFVNKDNPLCAAYRPADRRDLCLPRGRRGDEHRNLGSVRSHGRLGRQTDPSLWVVRNGYLLYFRGAGRIAGQPSVAVRNEGVQHTFTGSTDRSMTVASRSWTIWRKTPTA